MRKLLVTLCFSMLCVAMFAQNVIDSIAADTDTIPTILTVNVGRVDFSTPESIVSTISWIFTAITTIVLIFKRWRKSQSQKLAVQ